MSLPRTFTPDDGGYGLTIERSYYPEHVKISVPGTGLEWTMTVADFTDLAGHCISREHMRTNAGIPDNR